MSTLVFVVFAAFFASLVANSLQAGPPCKQDPDCKPDECCYRQKKKLDEGYCKPKGEMKNGKCDAPLQQKPGGCNKQNDCGEDSCCLIVFQSTPTCALRGNVGQKCLKNNNVKVENDKLVPFLCPCLQGLACVDSKKGSVYGVCSSAIP